MNTKSAGSSETARVLSWLAKRERASTTGLAVTLAVATIIQFPEPYGVVFKHIVILVLAGRVLKDVVFLKKLRAALRRDNDRLG